jgi:ABC-type transport system involved in cytochrome c biogenesis permease subunit
MLILLIVTFYGTIFQSYYAASGQSEAAASAFFSSLFVVIPLGGENSPLGLPLPGMLVTCGLLFINLVVGGIFLMRKNLHNLGVLIAHGGILVLLATVALGNYQATTIDSIRLNLGEVRYLPEAGFGILLHRFTPEFYPNTQKPKSFESIISITDEDGTVTDSDHISIRMNEPLRFKGWTFYQMSWEQHGNDLVSILRGSNNPLEQAPKWASYLIAAGLFLFYGLTFARYLVQRRRHQNKDVPAPESSTISAPSDRPDAPSLPRRPLIISAIVLGIIAIFVTGLLSWRPTETLVDVPNYTRWSPDFVNTVGALAVEDGGRIKPFSSYSAFALLRSVGKKTLTFQSQGSRLCISSVEWALDCMLRPALAAQLPAFLVNRDETVQRLGLPAKPEKRKRYSYAELFPFQQAIYAQSVRLNQLPAPDETDREIIGLANKLRQVELWMAMPELMLTRPKALDSAGFPRIFYRDPEGWTSVPSKSEAANFARAALFAQQSASNPALSLTQAEQLFDSTISSTNLVEAQGYRIPLERENLYYKIDPLYTAMALFIASFLLLLVGSLIPIPRKQNLLFKLYHFCWGKGLRGPWFLALAGGIVLLVGLVLRLLITMRSPVGNTFETITLIACACVLVSLVMELFNKRGIILIAGVVLGGLACQLGILYESVQATDHMDPLVAVLRSNFLLSTHVITIVLGYAAGLLAAVISHFAVFCQPLNLVRKPTVMALTRMAYGALAFSLLFTLVGTVFGGIWGNEAWGRFWGWDPKENGALMIVLWQLIVLHARRAGYIHVFGLHMGNIVGAIIIAFAWWGVNTMGVGLHSYGFAEGRSALSFFYIAELLVLIAATVLHFRWRAKNQA